MAPLSRWVAAIWTEERQAEGGWAGEARRAAPRPEVSHRAALGLRPPVRARYPAFPRGIIPPARS